MFQVTKALFDKKKMHMVFCSGLLPEATGPHVAFVLFHCGSLVKKKIKNQKMSHSKVSKPKVSSKVKYTNSNFIYLIHKRLKDSTCQSARF